MASTARPTTVMPIVAAGELIGSASIVEKHAKGDEDRGGAAAVAAAAGGAGAGGGTGVAAAGGRSTTSYDSDDASEREGGDSLPSSSGSSLQSTSDSDTRSFAPRNVVRSKSRGRLRLRRRREFEPAQLADDARAEDLAVEAEEVGERLLGGVARQAGDLDHLGRHCGRLVFGRVSDRRLPS